MEDDLLSIGALSRAGGIPVTALRFYDAHGVLRPAHVDPVTGYRWYTSAQVHAARLAASLRQAGLPVAELSAVLTSPHDASAALALHRRKLEEDLAAACMHLDTAESLMAEPGRCTLAAADLMAALGAVRHAVGSPDLSWPGLAGVLLHLDGPTLRLVACDRFRIAVATVPVHNLSGPQVRVVAPTAFLDAVTARSLPEVGRLALSATSLDVLGVRGHPLGTAYPDYEQLLTTRGTCSATVASRTLVDTSADSEVVVVRLDHGQVDLTRPGADDALGFSRTFLLDAVRAARAEHVALTFDDSRSALRIAPADRSGDVGLLMPIRLNR